DWLKNNGSSSLVASIDEFLKIGDELEKDASQKNEITELVLNQIIEAQENKDSRNLILVKEKRFVEFVKDLIEDIKQDEDDFKVDVDVYLSSVEPNKYDKILILGLKHNHFKDIVFWLPKAKDFTKVYMSAQIAFKIEREINILLELGSFEA